MIPPSKIAATFACETAPHPILYSFRRCPYAIRARMAIEYAGIATELREVLLRAKPQDMLNLSPKGTVPVLLLSDQLVIDQSMDIILWALAQHDPDSWLDTHLAPYQDQEDLIDWNDGKFKDYLDRYKYADRFPQFSKHHYREKCLAFLNELESRLQRAQFLFGNKPTLSDIAIFPFVRQFAGVDTQWFESSPYYSLNTWLKTYIQLDLFKNVMIKHQPWTPGDNPIMMPGKL